MSETTNEIMPKVEWEKDGKTHALLELGAGTRFPFRFGKTKVRLLLEAIERLGIDGFANRLQEFLEEPEDVGGMVE
jgi:hypothetical protein